MTAKVNTDKNIVESAKIVACKIADKDIRKRTYALNIAANAAAKYFEADTKQSLYKVPSFSANLELADIYINGVRYDIRVTFDGKTFCIPKVHKKYEAVPAAYIVVQLDSSLSEAEILGFVPSADLDYEKTNSEYFCYETEILMPIEEFEAFDSKQSVKIHPYSTLDHDRIKELCTGFIDDQITETEKIYFIKHVIACPVCRETFCDMNDFDTILSQLKNYEELLSDSTLSVFSGNKEEFDQALLAGLSVVENESDGILESDIPMLNLLDYTDDSQNAEEIAEFAVIEDTEEAGETEEIDEIKEIEEIELSEQEEFEQIPNEDLPEEEAVIAESSEIEDLETLDSLESFEELEELETLDEPVLEEISEKAQEEIFEESNEHVIEETPEEIAEEEPALTEEPIVVEEMILEENLMEDLIPEELAVEEIQEVQEVLEEPVVLEEQTVSDNNLEELHPVAEDVEIGEVDTLELGDLDTLDSLEPLGEVDTIQEEPDILTQAVSEDIAEENEIEPIEESHEIEELQEIPDVEETVFYQEPVELKYDDDEENSENAGFEETAEIESVEESIEEPLNVPVEEPVEEPIAEPVEEPVQNDEIQSLLDDDLLALLSDEEPSASVSDIDQEPPVKEFVPQVDESVFAPETEEEPDVSDSGDTIHTLFENQNEDGSESDDDAGFELAPEPVSASTINKTKQLAVAAGLVVLLAGAGAGAWFMNHQKASVDDSTLDTANSDQLFDFQNQGSKSGAGEDGQDTQSAAVSQDINRSMANSFSDKPAAISITKISWQVSEKLASEASVKEYLQTAGKNIQMNLQNDLANASDVAFNNSVKVSLEIAPDNTLKGAQVLTSSGSDKIDDVILRSIKNTLKYVNVPKLKDYKSDYFLTLIINF